MFLLKVAEQLVLRRERLVQHWVMVVALARFELHAVESLGVHVGLDTLGMQSLRTPNGGARLLYAQTYCLVESPA